MCFILSALKCYGALPQALEIIVKVQRKKNNEKMIRKKKSFLIYKTCFLFSSLGTLKYHNFLVSYSFKKI